MKATEDFLQGYSLNNLYLFHYRNSFFLLIEISSSPWTNFHILKTNAIRLQELLGRLESKVKHISLLVFQPDYSAIFKMTGVRIYFSANLQMSDP